MFLVSFLGPCGTGSKMAFLPLPVWRSVHADAEDLINRLVGGAEREPDAALSGPRGCWKGCGTYWVIWTRGDRQMHLPSFCQAQGDMGVGRGGLFDHYMVGKQKPKKTNVRNFGK